jgi:hypothetical protein
MATVRFGWSCVIRRLVPVANRNVVDLHFRLGSDSGGWGEGIICSICGFGVANQSDVRDG